MFSWAGRIYEGKDPTIISRELWERVQDRLDGHPYTREVVHQFAFTGLITCGHCGWAVVAEIKKQKYIYYHCVRRCQKERFVREEKLDEMLGELLAPLTMPPDVADSLVVSLKNARKDIRADAEVRLAEARAKYDRLGRLIDGAYEDKLEGRIDNAFFHRKRGDWEAKRDDLVREMDRIQKAEAGSIDLALRVLELANRAYSLYKSRDLAGKRELLDLVVSNCTMAGGELTVTYRNPFDLLVKLAPGPNGGPAPPGGPDGADPEWWRRRESNPRPRLLDRRFYVRSLLI